MRIEFSQWKRIKRRQKKLLKMKCEETTFSFFSNYFLAFYALCSVNVNKWGRILMDVFSYMNALVLNFNEEKPHSSTFYKEILFTPQANLSRHHYKKFTDSIIMNKRSANRYIQKMCGSSMSSTWQWSAKIMQFLGICSLL